MAGNREPVIFGHTKNQYSAAISVNVLVLGVGCAIAWLASAVPLLMSTDTPLRSGPISGQEVRWAAVQYPELGSVIGSILFGYLATKIGTKRSTFALVIPQMISSLLLLYATTVEYIFAQRFFTGMMNGGAQVCVLLYLAEIANANIRGKLCATFDISRNLGISLAYVLGNMWFVEESKVFIGISIFFAITYFHMPSTPQYLLQTGNLAGARDALKFYRGTAKGETDAEFDETFERLRLTFSERPENSTLTWKDIVGPAGRKGIIVGIVLAILTQFCGPIFLIYYTNLLLKNAGINSLSPTLVFRAVILVEIFGTLLATQLVERLGRKLLLIVSLAICAVGLTAIGACLYYNSLGSDMSMFKWVPVASYVIVRFGASVGIFPLSMICTLEHLPTKVRTFGLTVGSIAMTISMYVMENQVAMSTESTSPDAYQSMLKSVAICLLGIFFVLFFVDETKGKTLDLVKRTDPEENVEINTNV